MAGQAARLAKPKLPRLGSRREDAQVRLWRQAVVQLPQQALTVDSKHYWWGAGRRGSYDRRDYRQLLQVRSRSDGCMLLPGVAANDSQVQFAAMKLQGL
jgi:hypothetical protein